ncbi:hypothetical protein JL721_8755 [Aureococcus anophagefferens]|nr:hypothetical protein JL721_8755 [Aureococcus anophagefferens]
MSEPRAKVRGPWQDADTLQAHVTHVSGNCWVHAKSAIDKPEYRKLFRAQDNRARFKADVIDLANMSVVVRPQKKVLLSQFKAKWGGLEPVATRRWCAEYVDDERKNMWTGMDFEGGTPSQNQGLESTNRWYKEDCTEYQKKMLDDFLNDHFSWIGVKSLAQAQFPPCPGHEIADFRKAQVSLGTLQWDVVATRALQIHITPLAGWFPMECVLILANKTIANLTRKHGRGNLDMIRAHASPILQKFEQLITFMLTDELLAGGFDRLVDISKSAHVLFTRPKAGGATTKACSCKDFFLKGTCEHVLAWDIKNKKVEVPPQWDITVIGTKAKRGRKPNAKRGGALTEKPKSLFTTA